MTKAANSKKWGLHEWADGSYHSSPAQAGYDGTIHVAGTSLANGSGQPIQLRGGNMSGLEFVAAEDYTTVANWGNTIPNWDVYQTWKPNVCRIPLHAHSWLGITSYDTTGPEGTPSWGPTRNNDPQADYQATVIAAVAAAQAIGCYVILDLHWTGPQITIGGVTHIISCIGTQPNFASVEVDIPFWASIATMFGTQATPQPGINNNAIMFELFNEPFLDYFGPPLTSGGSPQDDNNVVMGVGGTAGVWPNGSQLGSNFTINAVWNVASYQQMLNAIRATGAQNVCIVNGSSYTQELSHWATYMPTDTLSPPQVAFGWHPYPNGTYPYSDGDIYPTTGNDPGSGTPEAFQFANQILAAGHCVVITEDGGEGGTDATVGEPHMACVQEWADANGVSYVFWQWNNPRTNGTVSAQNFSCVFDTDGVTILPIEGEGQQTYNWMVNHS